MASLNQHSYATLQQRSAEETDISDSSSDDDAGNGIFGTTSSSGSSTPAHLVFTPEETRYLRKGYGKDPSVVWLDGTGAEDSTIGFGDNNRSVFCRMHRVAARGK